MSACQQNNTKVVKELLGSQPDLNLTNQQVHVARFCAPCKQSNPAGILSVLSPHRCKKQCRPSSFFFFFFWRREELFITSVKHTCSKRTTRAMFSPSVDGCSLTFQLHVYILVSGCKWQLSDVLLVHDAGLAGLHCFAHCLQGRAHCLGQDSAVTQCRP